MSDNDRKLLKSASLTIVWHTNGDVTVDTGSRKVTLKKLEPPIVVEIDEEEESKRILEECQKKADEWYNNQYDIRVCTEYDSKFIDGQLYLGRNGEDRLKKDKQEYLEKLLDDCSYRKRKKPKPTECFGCINDCPGQQDHMGENGCLLRSDS